MNFDSDEQKATIFRAHMISCMRRRGTPAAVAVYDRYETYLADFLTLEEIQEKEENLTTVDDRMSKNTTRHVFTQFVQMANDPVRQKGYKRHSETCSAVRNAPQPPPLTAAEMEALLEPTDKPKGKPKGKPKKKKKKKVTGGGAEAQLPDVEAEAEPPDVEAEADSVVTHGAAEAEPPDVEAEADSVVTHGAAEAEPLNQKYSPIKTSSGDVSKRHDISRFTYDPTSLFSLFSKGIQIDEEGWYSVTPEEIAKIQAKKCQGKVVLDAFSGWGGNSIQFAEVCPRVIAIDIKEKNVEMGKHNAGVYGVADKIDFVVGDFFALARSLKLQTLKADIVFLSPPWGGPGYERDFKLHMLHPKSGAELFETALSISTNIIMYLPKTTDESEVRELANLSSTPLDVVIENSKAKGKSKAMTVYYSKRIEKVTVGGEVEVTSYFREKIKLLEEAKYRPSHRRH